MNHPRHLLFSGLLCLVTGACSLSSVNLNSELTLPAAWKNANKFPVASPNQDLSRWWGRFNDGTLNRLIGDALKGNPDLAAASARVRQSRANRDVAYSTLFPTIGGGASANRRGTHTDGQGSNSASNYSASLDASWEIDLFGKRRSAVEAAAANLGATQENLHSVHAALAAEIATAYTDLRVNQAKLVVLLQNISTREETARLAGWRQQAGEADSLESSQSQSSLESARAAIPSVEQAIARNKNQLTLLAGREPGAFDGLLGKGAAVPMPPSSLAVGIPADVIRQRPDVRIAGYQVLAAAASTRAADAERYPSLNLSGSLGLGTTTAQKLFNPELATAGLVAGISSPIFDAGRIRAGIEAASAAEEQAIQNYRGVVLTALSETEDALIACRRSAERLESLEKATKLARESDLLARQRYEAGEIDFLDVLDSQRTLLGLEDSLLSTRADRTTAYIRLYQALGGGWSSGS